ncbi:siderophore-interacting protein [Pinirhizobacter sp.]|jgi:NADPH-dependent ferric siderophore reductase|uniref:siderophore-interacting protein n=1 Tax=Pinirhizobacter sp. TaxID=2950432 RepID=UPI002F42D982
MTVAIHDSRRVRHPLVFRHVQVLEVQDITPSMRRVTFGGEQLAGFHSAAPDDHVKLFFPVNGEPVPRPTMGADGIVFGEDTPRPPMRDYTPRHFDAKRQTLAIDFVLHGDGPAASWAATAAPGQVIGLGGPRGSMLIADDFDHYVMVGDETALPAIGRWLGELPAGANATVLVEIADEHNRQSFPSRANVQVTWMHRDGTPPGGGTLLQDAVAALPLPDGDVFWWIATESRRARLIRQALVARDGVNAEWVKATGYWQLDPADD